MYIDLKLFILHVLLHVVHDSDLVRFIIVKKNRDVTSSAESAVHKKICTFREMLQKVSLFSEPLKITIGKHWFIVSGVAVSKQLYFFTFEC